MADLNNYRKWLLKVAMRMTRNDWEAANDLAQEGWIAMWRAEKTFDPSKGSLPSWLTRAAELRMTDVLRRGVYTGTVSVRGHHRSGGEPPLAQEDLRWQTARGMVTPADVVERVAVAYHEGQVRAAIDSLSPPEKSYILNRFWRMRDDSRRHLWTSSRKKLRQQLSHLEEYGA